MTYKEKQALLGYLEFHLVTLCDQMEKHINIDAIGMMYDGAYAILNDMEITLQGQIDTHNMKPSLPPSHS